MKLLPRLAIYGLMTVLVAGFFTVNASASSLPGDSLYGVKLGWEQTQLALAFDDDSRQELEDEFEDERLEEVESLIGEGREEDVEFHGMIESKGAGTWVVSGISIAVDALTELKGALEIGDLVKVEALTQADGSLLALEIYGEGADMGDEIDSEDEVEIEEEDEVEVEDDDVDDSSSDDDDSDSSDDSNDESEEEQEEPEEEEEEESED